MNHTGIRNTPICCGPVLTYFVPPGAAAIHVTYGSRQLAANPGPPNSGAPSAHSQGSYQKKKFLLAPSLELRATCSVSNPGNPGCNHLCSAQLRSTGSGCLKLSAKKYTSKTSKVCKNYQTFRQVFFGNTVIDFRKNKTVTSRI